MKNNTLKNDTVRHLIRSTAFIMVFITIFLSLEALFFDESEKAAAWEYVVSDEAEPIDILLTGNSHTFRSFDDQLISQALDINARVLACPSANGGIITADLTEFLTYTVPDIVVVELCPYMVNNYEDMRTNKQGIVYTHFESIPNLFKRFRALNATLDFEDVPGGMFQILRPTTTMKKRWKLMQEKFSRPEEEVSGTDVSPNYYGYMGMAGVLDSPDLDFAALEQKYAEYQPEYIEGLFCDENRKALEDMLKLADRYDFEIWLCVSPVAYFEKRYMDQLPEIEKLVAGNERVKYIDVTIGRFAEFDFNTDDFHDLWHLSRSGAQKLTCYMIELIAERLGLEPDYSDIALYKSESLEYLENGLVRCSMQAHGAALYRFSYIDENENEIKTEFSECNYFDVSEDILKSGLLLVEMKGIDDPGEENISSYHFMTRPEWTAEGE